MCHITSLSLCCVSFYSNETIKLLKAQLETSRSSESGGGVTVISKHRPQPQNKPTMVFQASSGLGIPEILAHAQAIKNYSANNFALNPCDTVAAWPTFFDMDAQKFILRELESRKVF